jgi:hypothetical protein
MNTSNEYIQPNPASYTTTEPTQSGAPAIFNDHTKNSLYPLILAISLIYQLI